MYTLGQFRDLESICCYSPHMSEQLKGKHILLLEDSKESARFTILILEKAGATVEWVSNPMKALKILQKCDSSKYDLVLTDIGLPSISGFEFCERAKKNPVIADVPFVALSGYDIDDKKSSDVGFQNHFTKPMSAKSLVDNIETSMLPQ